MSKTVLSHLSMERYNVIVLGAGSGGLTVAAGCAVLGARVAP